MAYSDIKAKIDALNAAYQAESVTAQQVAAIFLDVLNFANQYLTREPDASRVLFESSQGSLASGDNVQEAIDTLAQAVVSRLNSKADSAVAEALSSRIDNCLAAFSIVPSPGSYDVTLVFSDGRRIDTSFKNYASLSSFNGGPAGLSSTNAQDAITEAVRKLSSEISSKPSSGDVSRLIADSIAPLMSAVDNIELSLGKDGRIWLSYSCLNGYDDSFVITPSAKGVSFDRTGTTFTSTTVQSALVELLAKISNTNGVINSLLTDVSGKANSSEVSAIIEGIRSQLALKAAASEVQAEIERINKELATKQDSASLRNLLNTLNLVAESAANATTSANDAASLALTAKDRATQAAQDAEAVKGSLISLLEELDLQTLAEQSKLATSAAELAALEANQAADSANQAAENASTLTGRVEKNDNDITNLALKIGGDTEYQYTRDDFSTFVINTVDMIVSSNVGLYYGIITKVSKGQKIIIDGNPKMNAYTLSRYPQVGDSIIRTLEGRKEWTINEGEEYIITNCKNETFENLTIKVSTYGITNDIQNINNNINTINENIDALKDDVEDLDERLGNYSTIKEFTSADYSEFIVNTNSLTISNASSVWKGILVKLVNGTTFRIKTDIRGTIVFTLARYPQVDDAIVRQLRANETYKVSDGEEYLIVNCATDTFTKFDAELGSYGLVKEVETVKDDVEDLKVLKPLTNIEITKLYSTITKKQDFLGVLGVGLVSEKLSDGTIKVSKASGVGSDAGAWSGFYVSLDNETFIKDGHNYFIGFDVSLNTFTPSATINSSVRFAKAVVSPDTDAVKVHSILTRGQRQLATFSYTKTKDGDYYRMLFQLAKLYTTDSFELMLHNFYVIDLTDNNITFEQAENYVNTYKAQQFSLINNSINAITADYAKHFEGEYKEARYKGKYGVLMGDSHTTRRAQWITKVFNRMGAIHNETLNAFIVGKSTNEVADGYEDTCTPLMSQATRLIEKYNQGEKVDVVFIENVHYYFRDHTFDNAAPFKVKQIVQLGDYAQNVSEEPTWFNNNINTLLSEKTKKLGTMLKYTFRANCSKLTFSGTPKAGTITITFRGKNYPTTLTGKETLSEAVALIFVNFNNLSYDKATLNDNTITFVPNGGVYQHTITVNAGTAGLTATQTQESGSPTSVYRYFDSRNIEDWNTASHWYRLDYWNYGFGYFKGVIETLLEAIPNLEIIMLGLANTSPSQGQYTDDLGMNVVEWMSSRSRTREGQTTQLSIGKNYNLKTIDVDGLSGINSSNWFNFYNYGDVHPKPIGYERWADTIIRELGL